MRHTPQTSAPSKQNPKNFRRGTLVPARSSADPCVAARHVIGRLLDLSHISWRTCVADLLSDHTGPGIGARHRGQASALSCLMLDAGPNIAGGLKPGKFGTACCPACCFS